MHNIRYKTSYRNIKYPRLEFTTGELLLVLPVRLKPDIILEKHKNWIFKKNEFIRECLNLSSNKRLIERSEKEFRTLIEKFVKKISKELSIGLNNIYFRNMKTKWASLSPKRNLTINILMQKLPKYLIKYVIFHEITHLIEKRHNENFWKIVSKRFNNYRNLEKDLFIYWFNIQYGTRK
ncbi:MAG: M48 family metallopeptidase [Acidobacteriota bacterium]